jgi:hypothetical protein
MEVFRRQLIESFVIRTAERVRASLARDGREITLPQSAAQVELGIPYAAEFGLHQQPDVARFIELVCLHMGGFNGDAFPKPALSILYSYRADPTRKLDRFAEWCTNQRQERE